ncbi:MAG: TrmB family transcriptional regulator [Thermoplasmatota archaeon]
MQETLESLGLNAYESRALAHLLRHGERTGPDLSRETGIPFGRIYDTLHALVERGLATSKGGRPRLFAAVPASAIPGRLLAAAKRRLQEEERGLAQHAAALAGELGRLEPRQAPGSTLYGVRLGEDAAREYLVEATHEARERIDAYLAFEHIQDDDLQLFNAFRQAVGRKVQTRILLRARDVEYLLTTPYVDSVLDAMLPYLGEVLQVKLSDADILPFSVLDGERVVMGVRNPLDPRTYLAVIHLEDRAFARELTSKFETLWREGRLDNPLVRKLLSTRGGRAVARAGARLRQRKARKDQTPTS